MQEIQEIQGHLHLVWNNNNKCGDRNFAGLDVIDDKLVIPFLVSSAQEYVNNLLNEGEKVTCDESFEDFGNRDQLPAFYDEELFKRCVAEICIMKFFGIKLTFRLLTVSHPFFQGPTVFLQTPILVFFLQMSRLSGGAVGAIYSENTHVHQDVR